MEESRFSGMRRRTAALALAVVAAIAATALLAGSSGFAAVDLELGTDNALPDLDTRTASVAPTAAQLAAADALGADVSWNQFGTPSSVYNLEGNLATGVQAPDAEAAARAWLARNASLFRLASADDLALVKDTPLVGGDGHAVLLGQRYDGVLAAPDGLVTVAVAGTAAQGWNVTYASSTLSPNDSVATDYALSPEEAWVQSANALGQRVTTDDVTVAGDVNGWTELTVTGFDETQAVRKSAFPLPGEAAKAAFQTVVANGDDVGYSQTVDAASGAVLARANFVDNAADNPTWKAFPASPTASPLNRFPWNYPNADVRQTWCWTLASGCDFVVGSSTNSAGVSLPWDMTDPALPPSFKTQGNDATSREQWITASNNPPRAAGTLFQPTSPTRDYVFPFTNAWFTSGCSPAELGTVAAPRAGVGADISAATANLFAMHSRMHDWGYDLGFTESAWNAQVNNFTTPLPFRGNDPVIGNAQSGAITGGFPGFGGRDNANMGTRPDGTSSTTNMFLWQPIAGSFYAPCVDGDYDMSVIGHEFGHMIENRMIGKGNVRQGDHAGAMGEAFGDLNATQYLNENHFFTPGQPNPFVEGPYVTGNPVTGIRDYAMNWPMSGDFPTPGRLPHVNSLNLGDYEFDFPGQEVHSDGEIWIATNYTLRQLMLNRYPAQGTTLDRLCANGKTPVDKCPGDRRWIQLYFDAMLLMPTRPSLLDARNAILAADQTRFGGANQDILWRGFAERGFGQFAFTTTPAGNDDNPIPDFSSPFENNATVTFNAVSADGSTKGQPVNAKIYVGDYEARVTPTADTDPANDPATPAPDTVNLDNVAQFVPTNDHRGDGHHDHGFRNNHGKGHDDDDHNQSGDDNGAGYNFIANAPGYGHVRFRIDDLRPGEKRTVTIEFPTNVASTTNGAVASGDGTSFTSLIDDTESTNWESVNAQVQGRQVLIALDGRQTFTVASVSAMLRPVAPVAQNRFTALRQFDLFACDTTSKRNPNPTCDPANTAGWTLVLHSQPNAFPSVNPRPLVNDTQLRTWDVSKTSATHVLFRVLNNQCTGQTSYQGEQDNDPQFTTDCRESTFLPGTTTVAIPERDTAVRAAEVQLLTSEPKVKGAEELDPSDHGHDHD